MLTIDQCLKSALSKSKMKIETSVKRAFKIYAKTKSDLKILKAGGYNTDVSFFKILLEQQKLIVLTEWKSDHWIIIVDTPSDWKQVDLEKELIEHD